MSEERIFVGNGKKKELQYGPVIDITIDVDSIIREYGNHGFETKQGKRKIRLKIAGRKEPDQYGNDQTVAIDTWHPDNYVPPGSISTEAQSSEPQPQKPATGNQFSSYKPNTPKAEDFSSYGSGAGIDDSDIPF